MEANAYTISLDKEKNIFILTNAKGKTVKVNAKHKKYEWVESQEKSKIVKISDSGRWTSSKDYDGLYAIVKDLAKNKIAAKKPVAKKAATKVSKEKTSKPKAEKANTNKADAKLAKELQDLIEENKSLKTTIEEEKDKFDTLELEYMELEAQHDMMVQVLANGHKDFLHQAKQCTLTKDNVKWALKEYAKANAPKAKPKTTPKPVKEIKIYKIEISFSYDERESWKPLAKKGYGETRFEFCNYKDFDAPSKTLMKQLATYYLLNSKSMDSKFTGGSLPHNAWDYKKVKVDIISIGIDPDGSYR